VSDRSRRYTAFSVGPGAFYDLYVYEGLFLQPSLRFWPNVADTLGSHATLERPDGTAYEHRAHAIGFFANLSLGWTFAGM
jgi:hypothetical protein